MTQWGLDTLFNPAKRHMDEEKRRLQATREEAGDSSGGKRIDLESGKVTISRPVKDTEESEETENTEDTENTENEVAGDGRDSGSAADDGKTAAGGDAGGPRRELTPAQIRAARRRGRNVG